MEYGGRSLKKQTLYISSFRIFRHYVINKETLLPCGGRVYEHHVKLRRKSELEVLLGLLAEDVNNIALELELQAVADGKVALHVDGRDDDDDIAAFGGDMQMHTGAHHFRDVNLCRDTLLLSVAEVGVFGTDAERYILGLNIVLQQAGFLLGIELNLVISQLNEEFVTFADQLGIKHIHNGHADEACDEEVGRVIEDFLGSADLLDITVAHDDDTITERHGLSLVMGNVNEGGVDTLTELDDLSTHLITQLCVEVGERLVHQHDLRVTDDSAADGNTLSLAAGQGFGLALKILGDVENLCGFTDLLVNDILRLLAQLQGEGHVVVNRHVRIQSVVLEDHGDIAVFRRDVVHELTVDDQFTAADLFETGDHTKGSGFTASGRSDQNDEFLVGDVQVEFLNGDDAFIRDLEIDFLFLRFVCFLFLLFLLAAYEGVDLLDVFQLNSCHASDSGHPASAKDVLTAVRAGRAALRQVSTLPHPEPGDEHFLLIKAVCDLKMESRTRSQILGIKTRQLL